MCNAVSSNPLVMQTLCSEAPEAQAVPAKLRTNLPKQPLELQAITAEAINHMRLVDAPPTGRGDVLRYEANRSDFIFELFFGNGKEIVVQPLTRADAENTEVRWKQGETKLGYPETQNQHIVRMRIRALHQLDTPLLLRAVNITRNGETLVQLQVTHTGPSQSPFEPPMSYPPDPMTPNPHIANVSVSRADLLGHQPQTGFLAPKLPPYSMNPMMFQSTTTTSAGDPNHYKFQGKELDAETGLYNFGARYYNPALGRFMSPDWSGRPAPVPYANFANPQSLNLYTFGLNNPLSMRDSDGHCPGDDCSKVKVTVTADTPSLLLNVPVKKADGSPGYVSGAGTVTTVQFERKGKAMVGVQVKESPTTKDNLANSPVPNKASSETKATSDAGTIHDVVMGVITPTTPQLYSFTADDKAGMTEVTTTEPYNRTTDQTLTFSVNGQTCQCTYSETLSNVDANGNLNKTKNPDGTNMQFSHTDPVVKPVKDKDQK
jgi:RHS repeat-associated protein